MFEKLLNKNNKLSYIIFLFVLGIMLLCNFLTPIFADDFSYCFSFYSGKRIDHVFEIIPSLLAHAREMNGRLSAHFFVQFFLMLPKWIFNIVNASMFTLLLFLIYYVAVKIEKECNNVLLITIFGAVWVFTPAFGQVCLWLDGSCNYLWGYVFGFLFIIPYINRFLKNKEIETPTLRFIFVVFSIIVGAYSENTSPAFVCVSVLILLSNFAFFHTRPMAYEIFGVFFQ